MKPQSTFSRDHWRSDGGDQEPSGVEQYNCYTAAMYSIWLLPEQLLCSSGQSFSEFGLCRYWPPTGTEFSFHHSLFLPCRSKNIGTLASAPGFITSLLSVRTYGVCVGLWACMCVWVRVTFPLICVQEGAITIKVSCDFFQGCKSKSWKDKYANVSHILHDCLTFKEFHILDEVYIKQNAYQFNMAYVYRKYILKTCSSLCLN